MCTEVYYRKKEITTVAEMADAFGYAVRDLPLHEGYEQLDRDEDGHMCLCPVNVPEIAKQRHLTCEYDGIFYALADAEQPDLASPPISTGRT